MFGCVLHFYHLAMKVVSLVPGLYVNEAEGNPHPLRPMGRGVGLIINLSGRIRKWCRKDAVFACLQ